MSLREGDVVGGKYRLDREIARGGMGVVWAARHELLAQTVAIKALIPVDNLDPNAIERFTREARAAATLRSDHVVRVFDVGTLPSGLPFMAMEYLEGRDLADEMRAEGPIPAATACAWILEAVEALAEAHAAGIVHRDLKPSNLFLAARPSGERRIKILDFGISKMAGDANLERDLTSTRAVLGSPGYMSPEQIRNAKSVEAGTDVWSLGAILHELLTGRELFGAAETVGEVFAKVLADPIPSPRSIRDDVPADVDATVMRCLERDRSRRLTLGALREALLPYSQSHRDSSQRLVLVASTREVVGSSPTLDAASAKTLAPTPSSGARGRPSGPTAARRAMWLLAAGALVLLGAAGVLATRARPTAIPIATAETAPPRAATSVTGLVAPPIDLAPAPLPVPLDLPPLSATPPPPPPATAAASSTPRATSRPKPPLPSRLPDAPSSRIAAPLVGRE